MTDKDNYQSQSFSQSGDVSQDPGNHGCEIMLPVQMFTTEGRQLQQRQGPVKGKKKCHGNRKLQHFKRKWRARGLTEEEITGLIQKRNLNISERSLNDQMVTTAAAAAAGMHEQSKEFNKRKRDDQANSTELLGSSTRSLSQLSLSPQKQAVAAAGEEEEVVKRMKHSIRRKEQLSSFLNSDDVGDDDDDTSNHKELRDADNNCTLYKLSKYLRMPRSLLLQSLQLQLHGHRLKWKKKEKRFLFERLQLLDRQFYLHEIRCLYQFYFDQGAKYQTWLVSCDTL